MQNLSGGTGKRHHLFCTTKDGQTKRTNRYVAALDFLLTIPMENEGKIKAAGKHKQKITGGQDEGYLDQNMNPLQLDGTNDDVENSGMEKPGGSINLQGVQGPMVRIPGDFRHSMLSKSEHSAVVRQWEDRLLKGHWQSQTPTPQKLLASRLFFSKKKAYPIATVSIIEYDAGKEAEKITKKIANDQKGLEVFELPKRDWRGNCYTPLLDPSGDYFFERGGERGCFYDPNILDDPEMLHGGNRHVLKKEEKTGPIVSSVILYVNDKDLKEELNQQFRDKHPQLPPSLTLSKIRKLKKTALIGALSDDLSIECSTVALAVISFERLCLKGLVTKFNRRLSMAVSLLLAYKFNETWTERHYYPRLRKLLDFIDSKWEISRSEVFAAEFGAYVHLDFSLHVPLHQICLVYNRLLKLMNKTSRGYLGEEMDMVYTQSVMEWERARDELERQLLAQEEAEGGGGDDQGDQGSHAKDGEDELTVGGDTEGGEGTVATSTGTSGIGDGSEGVEGPPRSLKNEQRDQLSMFMRSWGDNKQ